MLEKLFVLKNSHKSIFYGHNNENLITIKNQFPDLNISLDNNGILIYGEGRKVDELLSVLNKLALYCYENNSLTEDYIINSIVKVRESEKKHTKTQSKALLYTPNGKTILPKNQGQTELVKSFYKNDLIFAIGPAGTGKTFMAIALAVKALKNKEIKKIILSRPAVEAGEKLGFLPGEMKDKLDPYLQPLYDALDEMIPSVKLKEYITNGVIQIAPLAFMRGRTLSNAVIILDEAQNTTRQQMKMFLTRLGENSKMIVTGDVTQIDLPKGVASGLNDAIRILKDVEGIKHIEFNSSEIVRHKLVSQIIEKYTLFEEQIEYKQK